MVCCQGLRPLYVKPSDMVEGLEIILWTTLVCFPKKIPLSTGNLIIWRRNHTYWHSHQMRSVWPIDRAKLISKEFRRVFNFYADGEGSLIVEGYEWQRGRCDSHIHSNRSHNRNTVLYGLTNIYEGSLGHLCDWRVFTGVYGKELVSMDSSNPTGSNWLSGIIRTS